MSFLEDREPPPRRSSSRPPRRQPPGRGSSGRAEGGELLKRRLVALVVGLLVLLALLFLVRSCRDSARERAFTDYARDSAGVVEESTQLSGELFGLLRDPRDQSPVELQSAVNGLAVQAEQLVDRGSALDVPDQLADAQRYLIESLELRRDGVRGVARELPTSLGDDGRDDAARRIAGEMRVFLASDVIYERRAVPALDAPLDEEAPGARSSVVDSVFLPDAGWLRPETVTARLSRLREGSADRTAAPGVHGLGLGTVTVTPGGTELTKGAPAEIAAADGLGFDVEVQNQGENEEEVTVRLKIGGADGAEPIELEEQLEEPLGAGESETVSIPLAEPPPTGAPTTADIEVAGVPGEKERENNRASFPVSFTE